MYAAADPEPDAGRVGAEVRLLHFGLWLLAAFSAAMLVRSFAGELRSADRLGAALSFFVACLGTATFNFSVRSLDGDPNGPRFLRLLAATIAAAWLLMLSTNLLLLFAAWTCTSLGLHGLLTYYSDRPEAVRAARKKFLISRLGDVLLLAAIAVIWNASGSFDLHVVLANSGFVSSTAGSTAAVLVACAALTKSAQFPFHSWLPETMESPTPVSALMHAGIVNAGGVLVLRFAPLVSQSSAALLLLSIVGAATIVIGCVASWSQVKVKRILAWSTVAQMGFMMVECGQCAFAAAFLHIIGHGFYKARSFLRSGEVGTAGRNAASPARSLLCMAVGVAASAPAIGWAASLIGCDPLRGPGEILLTAVIAIAVGQAWAAFLASPRGVSLPSLSGALLTTALSPLLAFSLLNGVKAALPAVSAEVVGSSIVVAWVAAAIPLAAILLLAVLKSLLPAIGRTRAGRAFFVHALNGFYVGVLADRLVAEVWNGAEDAVSSLRPETREVVRAA